MALDRKNQTERADHTQDTRPRPAVRHHMAAKALPQAAVVEAIRQAILADRLAPGQRLVASEICELLCVGRSAVRAALMDLVHEGLVEHIANVGARVRIVPLQEALQIAEVRLVVEGLCVARAVERITDFDIGRLRNLAKQLKCAAKERDIGSFTRLTYDIVETYVRIADQPMAKEVLERLRALIARYHFRLSYRPGQAQVSLPYWLDLVSAICDRDARAARHALQRHAENVQEAMRAPAHGQTPFAGIYSGGEFATREQTQPPLG
jgi:DNA-binding GntR family transcriptional regulator